MTDQVADASAFAGPETDPDWESDDLQYPYGAGTSALSLDQGTVEFHVTPGVVGGPATIAVRPPSSAIRIDGDLTTGYATEFSIERDPLRNDFTFSGRIGVRAEQSVWRPVTDLGRYAGVVALALLHERGIDVEYGGHVIQQLLPRERFADDATSTPIPYSGLRSGDIDRFRAYDLPCPCRRSPETPRAEPS